MPAGTNFHRLADDAHTMGQQLGLHALEYISGVVAKTVGKNQSRANSNPDRSVLGRMTERQSSVQEKTNADKTKPDQTVRQINSLILPSQDLRVADRQPYNEGADSQSDNDKTDPAA